MPDQVAGHGQPQDPCDVLRCANDGVGLVRAAIRVTVPVETPIAQGAANPIDDVHVALLPPLAPIALGPMVCPETTHGADAKREWVAADRLSTA